jgi:hypothetical protein
MIDCRFCNFDRRFIWPAAIECNANFAFSENLSKSLDVSQDALIKGVTVSIFRGHIPNHINKQVDRSSAFWWRSPPKITLLVKMGRCLPYARSYEFEHHFILRRRGPAKPNICNVGSPFGRASAQSPTPLNGHKC